ncbi:MAG: NAD(P)-binding domain-containing protein [Thermodesulfobacteriota bacterium]
MLNETNFLIIGAGPFGLSMSAYCKHYNIPYIIVGKTMDFWISNMPKDMNLRSGYDWHLDPAGKFTFEKYMETRGLPAKEIKPIPLDLYLDYTAWFIEQKDINPIESLVSKLDYDEKSNNFDAELENGEKIISKNVLLALGFKYFRHIPQELAEIIPENKFTHTCDINNFNNFKDKKCLIIGGRMSAFESAALLNEAGCTEVYISYRHETPEFTESEWNWVVPLLDKMVEDPNWYRDLNHEELEKIRKKFYNEGRLKMEPWLSPRLDKDTIILLPNTEIVETKELSNDKLEITINNGKKIIVDHIIMATGYKVNMANIPFLENSNIQKNLKLKNGYPELDVNLQTNIPGLYVTSIAAT